MKSIWEVPYLVVDVETSGSNPKENKIIEIACITVIGGEITDVFSSLVNPHQFIPPFIAKMTGISNELVYTAPEMDFIMPQLNDIFNQKNAVFVAHNARFDWSFVSEAFVSCGYSAPKVPRLCTVKLSRRLLPKDLKKNVGSLAQHFNINVTNRHRASGDAIATAFILNELLDITEQNHNVQYVEELIIFQNKPIRNFRTSSASFQMLENTLKELPEEPGVYYFFDDKGKILYIGKAKILKERVRSYFNNEMVTSKKISDLMKIIHKIQWDITDSELSALLLESKKIKEFKPPYNTIDKIYRKYPFIRLTTYEIFPKIEMCFNVEEDGSEYFGPFRSISLVQDLILTIEKQFKIRKCDKDFSPRTDNKPCFYYHIKRCDAPCSELTTPVEYALEIDKIRYFLGGFSEGIIEQMERKMFDFAENMQFEKAASLRYRIRELKSLFDRKYQVPTSVNKNNLLFILPVSNRDKTVELYLIKSGRLIYQAVTGRMASLSNLFGIIHDEFFNSTESQLNYTFEEIDELRIITSYAYRNRDAGKFIYIENKSEDAIQAEIEGSIRNIEFHPN